MEGIPIRTTLDAEKTVQHAALITQLTAKARSVVRDLDPQNDLTFLRIRSKKHEIMVAPDKEYILISATSKRSKGQDIERAGGGCFTTPVRHYSNKLDLQVMPMSGGSSSDYGVMLPPPDRRPSLAPIPLHSPFDFSTLLASRRRSSFSLGLWGLGSLDEPMIQTTTSAQYGNNNNSSSSLWSFDGASQPTNASSSTYTSSTSTTPTSATSPIEPFKTVTYRPGTKASYSSSTTMPPTPVETQSSGQDEQQPVTCCNTTFATVVEYFQHINQQHPQYQNSTSQHVDTLGIDGVDDDESDGHEVKSEKTWNRLLVNIINDDETSLPVVRPHGEPSYIRRMSAQFESMRLNRPAPATTSDNSNARSPLQDPHRRDQFLEHVFDSDEDDDSSNMSPPVTIKLESNNGSSTRETLTTPPSSPSDDDDEGYTPPVSKRPREASIIVLENKRPKGEWLPGTITNATNNNSNNKSMSHTSMGGMVGSRDDMVMDRAMLMPSGVPEAYNPASFIHHQQQMAAARARAAQLLMSSQYGMQQIPPSTSAPPSSLLYDSQSAATTMSPSNLHTPHYQSTMMAPSALSTVPSILSPNFSDMTTPSPRHMDDPDGREDDALGELDEDEWTNQHAPPVRAGSAPPVSSSASSNNNGNTGTNSSNVIMREERGRAVERVKKGTHAMGRSLSPGSASGRMDSEDRMAGGSSSSHKTSSSPKRLYKCPKPFCSKVYKNSNGLKYHLERGQCEADNSDVESDLPDDVRVAVRPYYCRADGCGKRYKNLNGLKYHAKVAHAGMDFKSKIKGHIAPAGSPST
ncbi:hypothetical protein SmJEL517_g03100 [Synchytrium microbalum]|uniref:C2H2-type domain-containing protein n=1 Tax=Synchytrium microbalum TaxID=1806994 RepID=A0A507C9M5_9FUNG|nr:uncharacterized protein SmJEL517_g03100 [Synchytrium microbalum]TPX34205.1 hypothetical protein SmJEL517_g03100 [Synchytrium microbalum]